MYEGRDITGEVIEVTIAGEYTGKYKVAFEHATQWSNQDNTLWVDEDVLDFDRQISEADVQAALASIMKAL